MGQFGKIVEILKEKKFFDNILSDYNSRVSELENLEQLIEIAEKELGISVIERQIHRSQLYLADEILLTDTAAHVTSVGSLDNRKIGSGQIGELTKKLQDLYFSIVIDDKSVKKKSNYSKWLTSLSV